MLKHPLWVPALALALCLPATASLEAGDGQTEDKVIVLSDEADADFDGDFEFEAPEPPDSGDVMVRIARDGHRGYLGVQLIEMTPDLRTHFGAPADAGVLIGKVEKDSPAAKAGVQVGDIVTAANGARVDSTHDVSRAVRKKKTGETVQLDLLRDKTTRHITVTVGELPERQIRVGELSPQFRKHARVFRNKDWEPLMAPLHDLGRLQEQLDDLDKRLKDIEKKLPAK
jgi:hypothetical protein